MTDQQHIDPETPAETSSDDQPRGVNRRKMFIAGAGVAGAAVLAKAGSAQAADGGNAIIGEENEGDDGATLFRNTSGGTTPIAGPENAIAGDIANAANGSHAVLGTTAGDGHAVAGVITKLDSPRAATWGRHLGNGPGTEGENMSTEVIPLAGTGNGVLGSITEVTNGSHAVKGVTRGAGHSVAGDTPADAEDGSGGPNTTAAAWGRHGGIGAGIGGVSADGYGGEFVGGKASARLIPSDGVPVGPPTDAAHLVGELFVDGAGDLYYNKIDGANFAKLNGGGIVMLPDPQRAFDSRPDYPDPANSNKGKFAADEVREIDLTEFTDLPAGASAAVINLTVTQTSGSGYLTVFNGDTADADRPTASNINWFSDDASVANGVTAVVGAAGTVKVYAKDATHVIVDVQGYISW